MNFKKLAASTLVIANLLGTPDAIAKTPKNSSIKKTFKDCGISYNKVYGKPIPQHEIEKSSDTKFLHDLAGSESSKAGDYKALNSQCFAGKYQMGTPYLKTIGYLKNAPYNSVRKTNIWKKAKWTGKDGVRSVEDFLRNPKAQEKALQEGMKANWKEIERRGLDEYIGKVVGFKILTESGMLAGAHIGGVSGLEKWLKDNSGIWGHVKCTFGASFDGGDSNKTKISDYVDKFNGYKTPFDRYFFDRGAIGIAKKIIDPIVSVVKFVVTTVIKAVSLGIELFSDNSTGDNTKHLAKIHQKEPLNIAMDNNVDSTRHVDRLLLDRQNNKNIDFSIT